MSIEWEPLSHLPQVADAPAAFRQDVARLNQELEQLSADRAAFDADMVELQAVDVAHVTDPLGLQTEQRRHLIGLLQRELHTRAAIDPLWATLFGDVLPALAEKVEASAESLSHTIRKGLISLGYVEKSDASPDLPGCFIVPDFYFRHPGLSRMNREARALRDQSRDTERRRQNRDAAERVREQLTALLRQPVAA